MSLLDEVLAANEAYAADFGAKADLALPPARGFAIERSVVADVQRIRSSPLVPASIPVHGYLYDVHTGRLVEVPAATPAGAAS